MIRSNTSFAPGPTSAGGLRRWFARLSSSGGPIAALVAIDAAYRSRARLAELDDRMRRDVGLWGRAPSGQGWSGAD